MEKTPKMINPAPITLNFFAELLGGVGNLSLIIK